MTIPSSGAISLDTIQTEFGGSAPTSISEYYAGGAQGYVPSGTSGTNGAVPSSGQISFSQFYGTSAFLDTQSVTVGTTSLGHPVNDTYYGYSSTLSFGSISDGTSNIYSGATISEFNYALSGSLYFRIESPVSNSGWTTMVVNGTSFSRGSASYSTDGSTYTYWIWYSVATNPFGTSGTKTVTWS